MNTEQLFSAGDLTGAVKAAVEDVKRQPAELGPRYRLAEFATMLFARRHTMIPREEHVSSEDDGTTFTFTGHKGFNWRRLEALLMARFAIERRLFTPMPLLGAILNSQVWFVCRKRAHT